MPALRFGLLGGYAGGRRSAVGTLTRIEGFGRSRRLIQLRRLFHILVHC